MGTASDKGLPVSLDAVLRAEKPAVAKALALLERDPMPREVCDFLDEMVQRGHGHVVGLTGPPGVGKSTLSAGLINAWRAQGRSVGVIAVDPSSRKSGGALLGDRSRIPSNPEDNGVFIRSLAARRRLGGLADLVVPVLTVMRAAYDVVLVETVGIGQSETDVGEVADSIVFCVQPGSGDSLQFMKAGIMEIPDLLVVTKADMGAAATRAASDLESAMALAVSDTAWRVPILTLSSTTGEGVGGLVEKLADHERHLHAGEEGPKRQKARYRGWVEQTIAERVGSIGLKALSAQIENLGAEERPFAAAAGLIREAEKLWASKPDIAD